MDRNQSGQDGDVREEIRAPSLPQLSSCLRSRNSARRQQLKTRSVSFPKDESRIVTGYFEPVNPWSYAESPTKESILVNYIKSCEKHGVNPIRKVLDQLEELPYGDGGERYDCLDLKGEALLVGSCEALEEVLKRVQFDKLNLEDSELDDEASVALFDMIEYYEAATYLNISNNHNIGQRGWQACSRMLKRTKCLEHLESRNNPLNESLIQFLSRALRLGTQLQVLKLENCSLTGRPIVILAAALKLNTTLKELYLAENDLTTNDATQLSTLLKCNVTLQLLDISNNCIADIGFGHLCDAICEQTGPAGLSILVLWNNRLKTASSQHLKRVLTLNSTLEMLNIGHNDLKDEFLYEIKEALAQNKTLLRIGMQSTQLKTEGAVSLAQVIASNPVLQRIDLRDNDLQVDGLLALSAAMKTNSSITQLDIDDCPKTKLQGDNTDKYMSLVEEMRTFCSRNEAGGEEVLLRAKLGTAIAARKISLTCDTSSFTRYRVPAPSSPLASTLLQVETVRKGGGRLRSPAPSPIPSPVASPSPTRTRFQVSKVSEDSPQENNVFFGTSTIAANASSMRSRFRVTTVSDTDDDSPPTSASAAPPVLIVRPSPPVVQPVLQDPATASADPVIDDQVKKQETPPRTRKLSSWMNPIFSETRAATGIEKLLGIFQNPFGTG
ncbi:protein phosphatase 1 regulatory subunit 37-like isoform X2 [Cimex lectularius]|nr:protein phosphatase 1 regulatory subunit 37-like isoform X2 [Cimex lectularius]